MDRIIIFTDFSTLLVPTVMTKATLTAVSKIKGVQVVGVCVRNFERYHRLRYRHFKETAKIVLQSVFDPDHAPPVSLPRPIHIEKAADKYHFKILIPPRQNINHLSFIQKIKQELNPTIALSYFCLQRFSPELLKTFDYAVNYHNGILPAYRGLMATAWSLYHREAQSGYTFHRINENLDQGNILIQGQLPVKTTSCVRSLESEKAIHAAGRISDLIKCIMNRDPGQVQPETGNYFSKTDSRRIKTIDFPSKLTAVELHNRLRAFDKLRLKIGNGWYDVTKLEGSVTPPVDNRVIYFQTSDGIFIRPTRFRFLPYPVYQLLNRFYPLETDGTEASE